MTSDFLRPILADPADDGPRLVYADWLDENGELERAEFIRVQIELAKYDKTIAICKTAQDCYYANKCEGNCGVDERDMICCPLRQRNDDLSANCFEWFEFPPGLAPGSLSWSRGFPSAIACTMSAFMGEVCGCTILSHVSGHYEPSVDCSICNCTGLVPGLIDTVFSQWPIVEVRLTDREPWISTDPVSTFEDYRYGWWMDQPGAVAEPTSNVSVALLDKMNGGQGVVAYYPTRDAALLALSHAAVDLGRERAGLPAIRRSK